MQPKGAKKGKNSRKNDVLQIKTVRHQNWDIDTQNQARPHTKQGPTNSRFARIQLVDGEQDQKHPKSSFAKKSSSANIYSKRAAKGQAVKNMTLTDRRGKA